MFSFASFYFLKIANDIPLKKNQNQAILSIMEIKKNIYK